MEKTFIMRLERVCAVYEDIKIANLTFDIKPASVTVIKAKYPEAVAALLRGDIVPYSGSISLAGVNVTERNKNERRVSAMPVELSSHDVNALLRSALVTSTSLPTVYEMKKAELKAKEAKLKANKGASLSSSEELKRCQIDIISIGLKMKRRHDELALNLKTSKALLSDLKKKNGDMTEYIRKLEAKVFSAQHEYCMYTHKPVPTALVTDRINRVISELGLSDTSTETELAFACAYATAPLGCICSDKYDTETLTRLCKDTGISIVCIAYKTSNASGEYAIEIEDSHFSETSTI